MEGKKRAISNQVMELQHLIAGPLIATIEADALSAQKYLDFLMKITFESYNPITGETGNIRMLTFTYTSCDVSGGKKQSVSIPILTLVPLPLLQVQEADFDFDIKILDVISESVDEKFSVGGGKSLDTQVSKSSFKLRVSLAPKQAEVDSRKNVQQSLSANMKVRVKMRQADTPAGLANLLHLTANNLQIEDV